MKKYFEFNKQDYYGLITVTVNENEKTSEQSIKATQVYVNTIGGESVEEVLKEGLPQLVSKEYAFWKLANCDGNDGMYVSELLNQFSVLENTCLVVDGALV